MCTRCLKFDLAVSLFPPALVEEAAGSFQPDVEITLLGMQGRCLQVELRAPDGRPLAELEQAFLEALTARALDWWTETRPVPAYPSLRKTDRTLDLTFHVTEANGLTRVQVTADPAIHHPVTVLKTLSELRGITQMWVESTAPLDRISVNLLPAAGQLSAVLLVLVERLSQIRRQVAERRGEGE